MLVQSGMYNALFTVKESLDDESHPFNWVDHETGTQGFSQKAGGETVKLSETPVKSKYYWSLIWTSCQDCSWKLKYSCTTACPQRRRKWWLFPEASSFTLQWGHLNPGSWESYCELLLLQKTDRDVEEGRGAMDKGIILLRPQRWPQHMMSFWKCMLNEEFTLFSLKKTALCWETKTSTVTVSRRGSSFVYNKMITGMVSAWCK